MTKEWNKLTGSSVPPSRFVFVYRRFFCFPFSSRCTFRRPSPSQSPILRILRARRSDSIGGRHHQFAVLARAQLSSPLGPPRHHGNKLEGRCFPLSGECPGWSQDQLLDSAVKCLLFLSARMNQLLLPPIFFLGGGGGG